MLGLSSSYFASSGFSIYQSVEKCRELGFNLVELGAAHSYEKNCFDTVKKIKKDFSDLNFTIHGLFPPLRENLWFNASLGLTKENRKVAENFFRAARILDAEVISFHPGFTGTVKYARNEKGFAEAFPEEKIPRGKAIKNLVSLLEFVEKKNSAGFKIAIENINTVEDNALIAGKKDFSFIFSSFPSLGMLFDVGHAVADNSFNELIELKEKFFELHLHVPNKESIHLPVKEPDLKLIQGMPQIKKIPIVLEHFKNVPVEEVLEEKKLVQKFLHS